MSYIGATGLDIFDDAIATAIEETTNTLTTLIITQDNLQAGYNSNYTDKIGLFGSNYTDLVGFNGSNYTDLVGFNGSNYTDLQIKYTSNYVKITSNILVQRIKQLEGSEGEAGDPTADPPIPPIPPTGNYAILATLGVLTAGATATAIVLADLSDDVNDLEDKVDLNAIYGSNYSDKIGIYSSNYSDKISIYSSNYSDKISIYSSNYSDKIGIYSSNYSDKIGIYSSNYSDKIGIYSSNYSDKIGIYSSNYSDKIGIYSSNYSDRIGRFGSNYTELYGGWSSNYTDKIGIFGSNYTERLIAGIEAATNYWTEQNTNNIYLNKTGNVGIGTNNPQSKVHIREDTTNTTALTIQNNFSSGAITSLPSATLTGTVGAYIYQSFTYTTGTTNTSYTITAPAGGVVCDILVVGGGGSGSQAHGGGGGAGAVIFMKDVNMNGDYTIKVGKGGVCETTAGPNGLGRKGNDTEIFKTNNITNKIVAEGGGGGGQLSNANGGSGGSGGGGDAYNLGAGVGGVATAYTPILDGITGIKYGNNGGNAIGNPGHGGGGGGAGAVGENATGIYNTGNNEAERAHGGVGIKSATINSVNYDFKTLFGTSAGGVLEADGFVYFGGGGGNGRWKGSLNTGEGGNGGLGGGGKGGWGGSGAGTVPLNGQGYPATANTGGGGGGGADYTPVGGDGGSGIVIIRYISPSSSSSIELVRGTTADGSVDYSLGNYEGDFKIKSVDTGTPTDRMIINSSGNVGIGTASHSTYKLDVNGDINISSGSQFRIGGSIITSTNNYWTEQNTNNIYLNKTGNVGIGTNTPQTKVHIYNATASTIRLETGTSGKSSIEFAVGTLTDTITDFRIINDAYELKFQYQDNLVSYGGVGSDIMVINDKGTDFKKKVYFDGVVGIKTPPDTLYSLDISGDVRYLSGNVGIGVEPSAGYRLNVGGDVNIQGIGNKYYINNTPIVSSQWDTSGTTIEYNGGSVGIGTSALSYKLNVNGSINATSILVNGATLDYNALNNKPITLIPSTTNLQLATGYNFLVGGNVGIGTTNPAQIFQVGNGRIRIANSANDYSIIGTADNSPTTSTRIVLFGGSATDPIYGAIGNIIYLTTNTGSHIFTTYLSNVEGERMRIANNGNVAIGTTDTGTYKLNLNGSQFINNQLIFSNRTRGQDNFPTNKIRIWGDGTGSTGSYGLGISEVGFDYFAGLNHRFYTGTTGVAFGTERMRIYTNGAVGIQGEGNWAIAQGMTAGSLTIGNITQDYGGQTLAVPNMAGLIMECNNNTEMAVHDSNNAVYSFMRYTTNGNFRIGRNMGWGVPNLFISSPLFCNSYIEVDGSILSKIGIYVRNSFDAYMYCNAGGVFLNFGALNTGDASLFQLNSSGGATNFNSGSSRNIVFNTNGYIWQFVNNGLSHNANNNTVWNIASDHRIKENIKKANLNICYNNVKNINLYRFNYINGFNKGTQHDKTQLGFIAQQVQQHYPKSVLRSKSRIEDKREIPDLASVSTDQINYTLFGAVKQLMKVVEKQSKRIKKLEEMLGVVDDDIVEDDADESYERIICDEVDIDDIEPSEPVGV